MNEKDESLHKLLQRTSLRVPFEVFLDSLQSMYPTLGSINNCEPITVGYESANILIFTSKGEYFLKIFESDRERANIDALIRVHLESRKIAVPVPELVQGNNGYLSIFSQENIEIPYFITRKFEGETFERIEPSIEDMRVVCQYMALLNTLSFPVAEAYDSWGNKNLVQEYDKLQGFSKEKEQVSDIVEAVRSLPLSNFSQSVIHGDMQTKHVLKSRTGNYCILDFGCMSFDARVVEFSTFLAWFCFSEKSWHDHSEIYQSILTIYLATHHLSTEEVSSIPILIRAAYASYYLKTCQLIAEGDLSDETKGWNASSFKLLQLSASLSLN